MTAPLFRYLSEREITAMLTRARKDGRAAAVSLGVTVGVVLCLGVVALVGFGLDTWRVANHDRLVAEATAKYSECTELWNRTQPKSYASAVTTMRQVDGRTR